ncbi:MAG: histidine kinase [Bacteroidales bacterium]|nr:histidine kinase [Bacteroidales bacterium]
MKTFLPFLLLVLIHHFLLAPLIRKRLPLYIGLTAALLVAFGIWCFSPGNNPGGPPPEFQSGMAPPPRGLGEGGPQDRGHPRPMRPEMMRLIMGVLLVGVDLGTYFYVESRRKERRMKELQAENLSQQLESLKYQINPHFFMNTLNNIHALVDIDPEKAKESIEVFSKMMRILLYENDSPTISLSKELDFIEHFISLMRLRYPEDSVKIDTNFPGERSGAVVPPLVMASFVENAFKHGVSYSEDSFIRIKVEMQDGKVVFRCSNSSHKPDGDSRQGIGLDNIRKRLALLYGQSYTLSIDDMEGQYDVLLAIPANPETTQQ